MKKDPVYFLISNIAKSESGCWLWQGNKCKQGYGKFRWENRNWLAHRFSYKLIVGDFDESLCVLHRCDVPACINPKHLFLGDRVENNQDCIKKGRAKYPKKKTHCIRGHEYSVVGFYTFSKSHRACKACVKLRRSKGSNHGSAGIAGGVSRAPSSWLEHAESDAGVTKTVQS